MKWLLILAVAALVAAAAGCGSKPPDHGTVIQKIDQPAYDSTSLLPVYSGETCTGGKYNVCTPHYSYIPYQVHHAEQFVLVLNVCDSTGEKCRTRKVSIGQADWSRIRVGDFWTKNPEGGDE